VSVVPHAVQLSFYILELMFFLSATRKLWLLLFFLFLCVYLELWRTYSPS